MDGAATMTGARGSRGEIIALQLVVMLFCVLRLYYDFAADLLGDEAYYWMWGQHLGWSYFDHPPLHAWLLRIASAVAGWHPFSVRLLTWLSLAGVLAIFWSWARRLAPDAPQLWFWRSAAIYLASPLFFGLTMIAYNDHLLVALSLLAVHCLVRFTESVEAEPRPRWGWLYAAALALGLATLTKYNGGLIGLGFLLAFLLRPGLRATLRTRHPWLAALLAIAMQAPVVYWNLTTALASFRYHLDDRWAGTAGHFAPMHAVNFLLLTALLWSPFLIWPLIRLMRSSPASGFEDWARAVALPVFAAATLALLAISTALDAYFYWNIVAFVGLMPLLTGYLRNALLRWAHLALGLAIAGLVVCDLAVVPPGPLFGHDDRGSSINFGWSEIAGHIRAAAARQAVDLYAATRYSTTAQLGFALGITNAVKLSAEHSQYDYWQVDADLAGKSALILTDEPDGSPQIEWLKSHFVGLSQADAFSINRFGTPIYDWRIFRGDSYRP